MAYPSHEIVMQFEKSSNDVIISDKSSAKISKTNKCKTFALTKSHIQVSQNFDKSKTSDKLFHRVFRFNAI